MSCDRCQKRVERMEDLIFTAYADDGGHFCQECFDLILPQVQPNFHRLAPQRAALLKQTVSDGEE